MMIDGAEVNCGVLLRPQLALRIVVEHVACKSVLLSVTPGLRERGAFGEPLAHSMLHSGETMSVEQEDGAMRVFGLTPGVQDLHTRLMVAFRSRVSSRGALRRLRGVEWKRRRIHPQG